MLKRLQTLYSMLIWDAAAVKFMANPEVMTSGRTPGISEYAKEQFARLTKKAEGMNVTMENGEIGIFFYSFGDW